MKAFFVNICKVSICFFKFSLYLLLYFVAECCSQCAFRLKLLVKLLVYKVAVSEGSYCVLIERKMPIAFLVHCAGVEHQHSCQFYLYPVWCLWIFVIFYYSEC